MKKGILIICLGLFFKQTLAQTPNLVWTRLEGTTNSDYVAKVVQDSSGNFYVTGSFWGSTLVIGTDTLLNNGANDMFFAKYDPNGNPLWAKSAGGTTLDFGNDIAVDNSGN